MQEQGTNESSSSTTKLVTLTRQEERVQHGSTPSLLPRSNSNFFRNNFIIPVKLSVLLLDETNQSMNPRNKALLILKALLSHLRLFMTSLDNPAERPALLSPIQRSFNNSRSATTSKSINKVIYGFTPVQSTPSMR